MVTYKKILLSLFAILLAVASGVSAESDTFYSAFDDAVKVVKDPIDESWEQSYNDIMTKTNTLEEYTCTAGSDKIICEKEKSNAGSRIAFVFLDDKLAAIDTYLSNSDLRNYEFSSKEKDEKGVLFDRYPERDSSFFSEFRVDDSIIAILTGKTWNDAYDENIINYSTYSKIQREETTTWSEHFFEFPENTYLQAGYQINSETNQEIQLRILLSSWKYLIHSHSPFASASRDFYETGIVYEKETVNEKESCTVTGYYNAKGEPVVHPEYGYAKKIKYYGDKTFVEGLPVSHPDKLTIYRDLEDNAVINSSGYAYETEELSEDGNISTNRFFDAEMKPVTLEEGFAAFTLETIGDRMHDAEITKVYKYFDADMNPVTLEKGYAGYSVTNTVGGGNSTTRYFDTEGNPVMISGGYAVSIVKKILPVGAEYHAYYGTDGNPVLTDDGYASYGHEIDEEQGCIVYYYRGVNDEPVIGPEGYAYRERFVRAKGDHYLFERYLDADRNLISGPDGYAYSEVTRTEEESVTRFYDAAGAPAVDRITNASAIYTAYDPSGNAETVKYFGVNDEPVLNSSGYSVMDIVSSADGQSEQVRYLDTENRLIIHNGGFAYSEETSTDGETLLCYYDPDGNRVTNSAMNVSAVHTYYSPSGNKIRIEYLDMSDELIPPENLDFMKLFNQYGRETGIIYPNWE